MSVLWTYAIVDAEAEGPPVGTGVAGEPLETLPIARVAVIHGRLETPAALSIQALRAHHAAVRAVADRARGVLPVRFGETAATREQLERSVHERMTVLVAALDRVRDRVQMTLRVFGPPAAVIAEEDPRRFVDDAGPGFRYLEQKRREAARRRCLPEIEDLRRTLRPLVAEERVVRADRHPLLGTVYDLLPPDHVADYHAAVGHHAARGGPHRVVASGPGAPWAFTLPDELEGGGRRSA